MVHATTEHRAVTSVLRTLRSATSHGVTMIGVDEVRAILAAHGVDVELEAVASEVHALSPATTEEIASRVGLPTDRVWEVLCRAQGLESLMPESVTESERDLWAIASAADQAPPPTVRARVRWRVGLVH